MIVVTPKRYLALLNRQLARHPDYEFGMRFVLRPTGGFDWEPKGRLQPFSEVSRAVRQSYMVNWRRHPCPMPASTAPAASANR
jgi:hypothetical protein